jgi:hypothetical protein
MFDFVILIQPAFGSHIWILTVFFLGYFTEANALPKAPSVV